MSLPFKTLSLAILISLCVSTANSQQAKPLDESQLQLQSQRLHAISMIRQSADEAPLWDNKRISIQVLSDAADLLWNEIPGQGKEWLTKAWDLSEKVSADPRDVTLKDFFSRSDQSDLRVMILAVARRHDSVLAEKFLQQLSQNEAPREKDRGAFDDRTLRSEQLLQTALQTVESNPEAALNLAEQSLSDGISYTLQSILTSLRRKKPELANKLFDLALLRFSNFQSSPAEAQILAGYLFQSGFTFSSNRDGQTILVVNPAQQSLPSAALAEPQRARNFLIAVYQKLLTRPASTDSVEERQRLQETLILANRLVGPYRSFAEELLPSVQGFLAEMQRRLHTDTSSVTEAVKPDASSGNSTKRLTAEELYEKRISDMEEEAERKSNSVARELAYVEVALAVKAEDHKRGRRIAEKIEDDNLRSNVVSFILYRGALAELQKGDSETASELAPQITDTFRRAVVRISIASQYSSNSSKQQTAFSLMSAVERDLEKEEASTKLAKIALGRAAVIATLDKDQALMALEKALEVINKLDGFDFHDETAPDLGIAISSISNATVARPRLGFSLSSVIQPLVLEHFEDVAAATGKLRSRELRGVAQLDVAKLYLQATHSTTKPASLQVR